MHFQQNYLIDESYLSRIRKKSARFEENWRFSNNFTQKKKCIRTIEISVFEKNLFVMKGGFFCTISLRDGQLIENLCGLSPRWFDIQFIFQMRSETHCRELVIYLLCLILSRFMSQWKYKPSCRKICILPCNNSKLHRNTYYSFFITNSFTINNGH